MPNIIDILARALSLRQETALNSITPNRAGGIMYDTLLVLNQMQLEGGSLLISKVYASVSAMEADTTPTSDLTGRALKPGQLVVIVTSDSSSSDMGSEYRFNGPGSWTYVGKVGGLPLDTVPTQSSTKGITSGGVYTALAAMKAEGYKYMGLATPGSGGTAPGTPNQPVFYIAGPGSYPNFGSITVASGYLGFIKYSSGSWTVESVAVGKDYDEEISQLQEKVVEKAVGKNLYDGVLESGYFKADGTIGTSSVNSHTKNYIPVEPETQYHISQSNDGVVATGATVYICFYNAQKQFLSSQDFTASGIKDITTPENCYFIRTTIRDSYDDKVQIEKGNIRTAYEPYNPISRYLTALPNNSVSIENIKPESFDAEPTLGSSKISRSGGIVTYADRELVKVGCKNIYDGVIDRGYFKADGTISDSSVNYHTINYLPVLPNTQYHLSRKNDGAIAVGANVYICYYDSSKNFLSSESLTASGIKDITTPLGCYYIRTTIRLEYNDEIQIELGNARTSYVPYNPIYNYLGGVRGMENELKKATNLVGSDASSTTNASLSADTSLTLPEFPTRLKKRLAISFTGKFSSFSSLSIGQNYKTSDGAGIKIDGTNVYAMNYSNGTEDIRHTVPHGIPSFANYISVTLYIDSAQTAFVTIVTDGGSARVKIEDYNYAHSGIVFANPAMSMTDVKLNATCADFRCPVWAFGDSYFGLSIVRVGYWLRENGFFNLLFDGLGGENATGAMSDLNLCLNFGTPKYIVWALGMNGASDSNGQPDSTWLAKSQELIALCEAKGITPIFCTIPTVPGRIHEALSAWVRNSGYRYIDVADAVGSQADGTWYDGMLSSDNIHPTQFGAKVIAQRWLIDFPEIMQYGIENPAGENTMITV